MRFKKMLTAAVAASLISVLFVMPVSAHGHHGSQGHHNQTSNTTVTSETTTSETTVSANTDCPVCTVDGCTETGRHSHDGTTNSRRCVRRFHCHSQSNF